MEIISATMTVANKINAIEWLLENTKEPWSETSGVGYFVFTPEMFLEFGLDNMKEYKHQNKLETFRVTFANKEDAAMFKLIWG